MYVFCVEILSDVAQPWCIAVRCFRTDIKKPVNL